ncbi:uncharacterized protein LOC134066425 [Sardina pilchardus]|uniref:uncharacterized protein LOC134066425 n=1 Tax=Sardina pilchardus TaxID=27697 RepID=UPI002E0F9874
MDHTNGVQPCAPTELLLAAQAFVDNVIKESIIEFTSGPNTLRKGSILRKDVTAIDLGKGPRISWAADLNDGSERSWNQSSPGSADSFPFAVHPRCEDIIREDKMLSSADHPYKTPERSSYRLARQPSPLSADLEQSSPATLSSVHEEMKSAVNQNNPAAPVSETSTSEARKVRNPLKSLRTRLQTGPCKVAPSCCRECTQDNGCCLLS